MDGEGNGTPLQYSCLENPMDGGAWWAAIYGVAQSRTRLKRLSSSSSSEVDEPRDYYSEWSKSERDLFQVYAPTSNAKEAEVEQFYEDLQDLLELTPKKDVLFILGDWNEEEVNRYLE